MLRNNHGFSLTEMAVTVGVTSIIMAGLSTVLVEVVEVGRRSEYSGNKGQFVQLLRETVFAERSCMDHLAGNDINQAEAMGAAGTPVVLDNLNNLGINEPLEDNTTVNSFRLHVVSLRFANAKDLGKDTTGSTLLQGQLLAQIAIRPNGEQAAREIVAEPILAIDANGGVTDCKYSTEVNAAGICDVGPGGGSCLKYYDATVLSVACGGRSNFTTGLVVQPGAEDPVIDCGFNFDTGACPANTFMQNVNFAGAKVCVDPSAPPAWVN